MAKIYTPKGAAREYSPLSLNYIKGCSHGCAYCYVPKMMKRFNSDYKHSESFINERVKLIKNIESSAKRFRNSKDQVFLSFTTDAYSEVNSDTGITREVLEILLKYNIPVSILTKSGSSVLDDIDLFKKFGSNIQIGSSLVFNNDKDQSKWEPNASSYDSRVSMLELLKEEGIRTWASIEPVIIPRQSLEIIDDIRDVVDYYKVGKINHFKKIEQGIDWTLFLNDAIAIMRKNSSEFYIKNDLFSFADKNTVLSVQERDMDFFSLKNNNKNMYYG